jgi:muramoyltetrapeptide carboxypeptidase LdcA involved in peptidoglycan recycling
LDYAGAVLFWDIDWDEEPPPVRELLNQLHSATDLRRLAGMLVGANPYMNPQEWADFVAAELHHLLPDVDYPLVVNVDLGHSTPSWVVPFSEGAVLDPAAGLVFPRNGAH